MNRLRYLSWFTFATGMVFSVAWAWYQQNEFERLRLEGSCGMPILAMVALTGMLFGLLSLLAGALNFLAFRLLPAPREFKRKVELTVLGMPAVALGAATLWALLEYAFSHL